MRELRHDFRRYYGCAYDEVEPDEALDLIATLPRGSLYRSSHIEFGELTDEDERAYDLIDEVKRFMQLYATGSTEGAVLSTRPQHLRARRAAAEQARAARERIEQIEWEEA